MQPAAALQWYKKNTPCCTGCFLQRAEDEIRTRDPHLGKVMLYQLSYFRVSLLASQVAFKNCPVFFGSAKIGVELFLPNIFLALVFGSVLRALRYLYLGLALIAGSVQIAAAASYKSKQGKYLHIKQKTAGFYPVPAKLFVVELMLRLLRHVSILQ